MNLKSLTSQPKLHAIYRIINKCLTGNPCILLDRIFAVKFLVPTENWVWLLLLTLLLLRLL